MHSPNHDSTEVTTGKYPYTRIPVRNVDIALTADGLNFVISWEEPDNPANPGSKWFRREEKVYDRTSDYCTSGEFFGNELWRRGLDLALRGFQKPDGSFCGGGEDHHREVVFRVLNDVGNPMRTWTFHRNHHSNPFVAFQDKSTVAAVA